MGGNVTVKLNLNATGYSAEMAKAKQTMQGFTSATREMGHGTVSQMQASSAAIRVVEGNMTNNIRAAEKFISTIPGVGRALQAAFPVVGAIAFLGVVGEVARRIYDVGHEVSQMGNVANEAFSTLQLSSQKSVDSIRLTNDKLEEQIAILEKKPVNTIAMALDEARVRADELATSLNKDYTEFKKILDAEQYGHVFANLVGKLMGKGDISEVASGTEGKLANIRTLGFQAEGQREDGDTAGANATEVLIQMAQKEALKWAKDQVAMRKGRQQYQSDGTIAYAPSFAGASASYAAANGDQSKNLDALAEFQHLVRSQQASAQQNKFNVQDEEGLKRDQAAKRATEEAKRAAVERLKAMQEEIAQQNAMYGKDIASELAFWSARISAFSKGSSEYHAVQMEQYKLQAELLQKLNEGKKKYLADAKGDVEGADIMAHGADALNKGVVDEYERRIKSAEKYREVVSKGNEEQEKAASAFAENSIHIALAQGSISNLDAAQAMAAIHADDHAKAIDRINEALADQIALINSDPALKTDQDRADAARNATEAARNQTQGADSIYADQRQSDRARISGDTISGAVRNSLSEMVRSFTDMAANLKNVIPRTIEGLNNDVAHLATGQYRKGDVGRTLLGAGQGLVKSGLQAAEGGILQKLGLGKRDGSSALQALWVQSANSTAGLSTTNPSVSAGVGSLASLIPGGSFIQPFIKPLMNIIPHFAAGGDFLSGNPMIVGERGPELMIPRGSGTVIPNGAGGGNQQHFHIDARGSSDPAATHAAIMRAAPAIAAAGVQASHDRGRRTPHGR